MAKFHINKHGVPAPCHAKDGNCPLGGVSGNENHFDNLADAEKAADKINEGKFGILSNIQPDVGPKEKVNLDLSSIDASTEEGKNKVVTEVGALMARDMLIQNNLGARGIDNDRSRGNLNWEDYGEDSFAWSQDVLAEYPLSENERIYENQREVFTEMENAISYLNDEAKESDDAEEIVARTERSLTEDFKSRNFNPAYFKSQKEELGTISDRRAKTASEFLEYAMTDEKAYRYFDPEVHPADEQEYISHFAKARNVSMKNLDHWATQRALSTARNYYRNPLRTSFTGNEKRAAEIKEEFLNALKNS